MQTTTMRVATTTRDALAQIAEHELGGVSLDEALRTILFHYRTAVALARLAADAEALDEYRDEVQNLAETDVAVSEW